VSDDVAQSVSFYKRGRSRLLWFIYFLLVVLKSIVFIYLIVVDSTSETVSPYLSKLESKVDYLTNLNFFGVKTNELLIPS
jgi:hypothetical protein